MQGHLFACRDTFLHAGIPFCMQGYVFACRDIFWSSGKVKAKLKD